MKHRKTLAGLSAGSIVLLAAGTALGAPAPTSTGPSSSQTPYLVPTAPGVTVKSVLTVGDTAANGYKMVGIPDGLGAFENEGHHRGHDTFTLLMNHELGTTAGVVRAHGSAGAFVSRWVIDAETLQVVSGEDAIQQVNVWNGTGYSAGTTTFTRFCSADLPAESAFYDRRTKLGTKDRIFMNGEESGVEGRAFATIVSGPLTGQAYQLPALGRFSWENSVARPDSGVNTVVVGMDDGTGGQVYVYVGPKTRSANPVEAAGLTNGTLYAVKVDGLPLESNSSTVTPGTSFSLMPLGDVRGLTGAQLEAASVAAGATSFQRPEDGSWAPRDNTSFSFVTTASFTGRSRLWNLDFSNPADVTVGGTISVAINNGPEPVGLVAGSVPRMMDNLTVNDRGQVIIQEDIGNQTALGQLWQYDPATGTLRAIAQHDPARFGVGAPGLLTLDEESSGIIPMKGILGRDTYLAVVQAHYGIAGELVEGGQLVALKIPRIKPTH